MAITEHHHDLVQLQGQITDIDPLTQTGSDPVEFGWEIDISQVPIGELIIESSFELDQILECLPATEFG